MKKFLKWVGIIIVGLFVLYHGLIAVLNYKERHVPTPGYIKAQTYSDPLSRKLNYTINGVNLEVPLAYINGRVPNEGEQPGGIRLIAWWPDMRHLEESQRDIFRRNEERKLLNIFLLDPKRLRPISEIIHGRIDYNRLMDSGESVYGLEYFKLQNPEHDRMELFAINEGSFIECMKPDRAVNPLCEMYFEENDLFYQITFSRDHLPEWQAIRTKALHLTNGFISNRTLSKSY